MTVTERSTGERDGNDGTERSLLGVLYSLLFLYRALHHPFILLLLCDHDYRICVFHRIRRGWRCPAGGSLTPAGPQGSQCSRSDPGLLTRSSDCYSCADLNATASQSENRVLLLPGNTDARTQRV